MDHRKLPALLVSVLSLVTASESLLGQSAAPGAGRPSGPETEKDQTVELSPFVVSTDKDQGYLAANTLGGTRLNSSLYDTPASLSVMTSEFIADIAATSVTDTLAYALNAERDTTDGTGNANATSDLPLSIRGFTGASLGRNYFQWGLESDTYNTERLDFSRGPNSILFGVGGPGGIINTTTKRAQFGRSTQVLGLRVGSSDDYRATFDLNRQLGKTFALRLNAVRHSARSWRDAVDSDREGLALAATFRPWKNTEIRFDGEYGKFNRTTSNPFLPGDGVSAWISGGRQVSTVNATTPTTVIGAGRTTARPYVYDATTGGVFSWSGTVVTSARLIPGSTTVREIMDDFSILPLKANVGGEGNRAESRFNSAALFFEQRIGDIWIEAAYSRQEQNRVWLASVGFADSYLLADANAFLPNGSPNPKVGMYYVESNATLAPSRGVIDDLRLTTAYTLDLNKRNPWFGSYSFTGLLSRRVNNGRSDFLSEVNTTPVGDAIYPLNLANANNRIRRRYYIVPFGPGPKGGLDARDHQFAANGVTSAFARITNQGFVTREELDSSMVAAQAKILKDRLVITGGLRRDRQKNFSGTAAAADRATGLFPVQTLNATSTDFKGQTKTYGAVVHLTKWAAAFYNKSDNFVPQSTLTILGTELGPRFGKGEDYGLKFRLLDGRLYAGVTRYQTSEVNRLNFASGTLIDITNELFEAVGDPTRVAGPTSRDSVDTEGQGHEFEVTANLTPQWRLTANFSQTEGTQSNNQPRLRSFIAAHRAAWEAKSTTPLIPPTPGVPAIDPVLGGQATVATALRSLDPLILNILGANGVTRRQLREHTGSFFTAYTFRSDKKWLNGLTAGAGSRDRSAPAVGYINGVESIYGDAETTVNLMFAKTIRIRNRNVRLQTNLDNIFNANDPIIADADVNGVNRYLYPNPFRWTFSATINL